MTTARIPAGRLVLEGVSPSAAAGLRAGGGGGFTWLGGEPFEGTRDAAGMIAKAFVSGVHRPEFGLYVLVRQEDGRAVGSVSFHAAPDEDGRTEIGYDLVEAARGHGYATEALRALAAWALARDDVSRLFAVVGHANSASRGVLERAGFVKVGEGDEEDAYELRGPVRPGT
ncbi:GNAT family N-acetyltransferase [Streptomyces maremycinicus]|uniref:GNAT family N-acetyltransferase n=1 Tax=Streptomyces maremycinicus TaxID=1679753 RepID=UPI000787CD1A